MSVIFDARVAARGFDAALSIETGETVAVLGPNGAGKSTLLALLAGLLTADCGTARLDDTDLFALPAHRREVSLLAQDALLFPHLSVLENVAFGPRSSGASREASRAEARRWLDEVDAADFAGRRPGRLSGGQAQRVAIARALASGPRLLLLDEPMAALDVTVVPTLRGVLRRVLADRTVIIVTHDVVDAYTLADRVIVMEGGRIVDSGPTAEVLGRPRTAFAAALVGLNLLADGSLVAPSAVSVAKSPVSANHAVDGLIESIETRGDLVRIKVGGLAADLSPAAFAALSVVPGDRVSVSYPAAAVIPRSP